MTGISMIWLCGQAQAEDLRKLAERRGIDAVRVLALGSGTAAEHSVLAESGTQLVIVGVPEGAALLKTFRWAIESCETDYVQLMVNWFEWHEEALRALMKMVMGSAPDIVEFDYRVLWRSCHWLRGRELLRKDATIPEIGVSDIEGHLFRRSFLLAALDELTEVPTTRSGMALWLETLTKSTSRKYVSRL
jgi:hypothetical protein